MSEATSSDSLPPGKYVWIFSRWTLEYDNGEGKYSLAPRPDDWDQTYVDPIEALFKDLLSRIKDESGVANRETIREYLSKQQPLLITCANFNNVFREKHEKHTLDEIMTHVMFGQITDLLIHCPHCREYPGVYQILMLDGDDNPWVEHWLGQHYRNHPNRFIAQEPEQEDGETVGAVYRLAMLLKMELGKDDPRIEVWNAQGLDLASCLNFAFRHGQY